MNRTARIHAMPAQVPLAGQMFIHLLGQIKVGHLQLITPQGNVLNFGDLHASPAATLQLDDWRACSAILRRGDIGLGEAVEAGWVRSPDMTALVRLAIRNENAVDKMLHGNRWLTLWHRLQHALFNRNTRRGSRRNIHAHYDLGNDFYRLWLDATWSYSSALYARSDMTLEEAQAAKYQRIVDVLQLKPGMKVLEIGCGWGGFALHAARQGIGVRGITISPAQLEIARARFKEEGLAGLASAELLDYRDLAGQYDAVVSIEMFEAVGEQYWPQYFRIVQQCLKPHGRALVQSITIEESQFERYRAGTDFIQQYIFPGGMLPSPVRLVQAAARQHLACVEDFGFGQDYARTLREWQQRFLQRIDAISLQGFDECFIRIWRLYLSYCEAAFAEARTDVRHFLLEKSD